MRPSANAAWSRVAAASRSESDARMPSGSDMLLPPATRFAIYLNQAGAGPPARSRPRSARAGASADADAGAAAHPPRGRALRQQAGRLHRYAQDDRPAQCLTEAHMGVLRVAGRFLARDPLPAGRDEL